MYPAKSGLVIGFHGCDETLVNLLVNGQTTLKASKNRYDWLGTGVYFWENNHKRALSFAQELMQRTGSKIKKPAVVGAIIDMGFCMDLMDDEHIQLVDLSYRNIVASSTSSNKPIPVNTNVRGSTDLLLRDLDCAVINNLHKINKQIKHASYDSVRCAFIEGAELYTNAGFHAKNHIQICIRNPNCIKGYFLPRVADGKWLIP